MGKKSLVIMVLAVLFAAAAWELQAAHLHVTTTADRVPGSLRAAITNANTNGEDDTIHLPAGLYILEGDAGDDANASGDLDIDTDHSLTIKGESTETTIIDGKQVDRILHILRGTVSIEGVTFQKGKPGDGRVEYEKGEDGGGILNRGTLTLSDCQLRNNRCGNGFNSGHYELMGGDGGSGGAIYNEGSLTLNGVFLYDNAAGDCGSQYIYYPILYGRAGHGGAICNKKPGAMVLKNCRISNNNSGNATSNQRDGGLYINGGDGGGIYNEGSQELFHCAFNLNHTGQGGIGSYWEGEGRSGQGGAIYNSGNSLLKKCAVTNNYTGINCWPFIGDPTGGGGIYNTGTFSLSDCNISYNTAYSSGSGGGIHHHSGTLTLAHCAITNNKSGDGIFDYPTQWKGGDGGGIFNESTMTITNCTISSNHSGTGANSVYDKIGGNGGAGAGIYNRGKLTLINATLCQNITGPGGNGDDGKGMPGYGGGIYIANGSSLNIKNTIVANNTTADCGEGADVWGTLNSQGYNLIENTNDCTITGILTGNITGVDPLLGPLANNGGLTQTHALLPGSPAIDAGNSPGIIKDQRGYTRPLDIPGIANKSDGSDIGAYELEYTNPITVTISGTVTYDGKGLANVTLTFSNQGETATTDSDGNYSRTVSYGWTGTVSPTLSNYIFTPTNRSYSNVTEAQQDQDYSAAAVNPPQISLDRSQLNFSADTTGHQTGMQTVTITNSGGGILNWTISDNTQWLNYSPTSGTGAATVTVTVDPRGLSTGTYTGAILVESPRATNSPKAVPVTLTVYNADAVNPPFGSFDTPLENAAVTGSIPLTGWALDDIGVANVKIYNSDAYIGDAVFVEGARPDIETAYPDYPTSYKAGWGYMLLTYSLPNGGNGNYTLTAKATDMEGNEVTWVQKPLRSIMPMQ